MKGFVPTPPDVVDQMVAKLFEAGPPPEHARILDPGCGPGAFVEGLVRYAERMGIAVPRILGVDSDPRHVRAAQARFQAEPSVEIREVDFLEGELGRFDYIIGNPPYVPITGLTVDERDSYRARFHSAKGRFDLYLLFYEQALRQLRLGGRLVFVTPEKFIYVDSARPFRGLLARFRVVELELKNENTFPGLVTYPAITTLEASGPSGVTTVRTRDGAVREITLPANGNSWLPALLGHQDQKSTFTLVDAAARISCGVATGSDGTFVLGGEDVPADLRRFAYPTISGRELSPGQVEAPAKRMLVPYTRNGALLRERELGPLGKYLCDPAIQARLRARTCADRKPWYAFHETPQLGWMLRPKILCKDISPRPQFFLDRGGNLVPRHSVYYIVPARGVDLAALLEHLNSQESAAWLLAHCQRAANGYLRLQSAVLKRLPIPRSLLPATDRPVRSGRRTA